MIIQDTIAIVLMVVGAVLMLLAAVGLLRLPDVLLRMSAASKAATLGVACILLAVAEDFADVGVATRALATILFMMLTVPIASHLIGRAAYLRGSPLWEGTRIDELKERYADDQSHTPSSAVSTQDAEDLPTD